MPTAASFTFELTKEQQAALADALRNGNYRPWTVEHTLFAAAGENVRIAMYKSGKCVVQGAAAADFVSFVMEPLVLQEVRLGYEDVLNPEALSPHIGVDESGKGDFFGPLVTAAAYVDAPLVAAMREMGVKDSKRISSDARAREIARALRDLLKNRYDIVVINPARYNSFYRSTRNVNRMLAWAHARTIENMLGKVPDCPRAISDQFGSKQQVERALMQKGRRIELIQRPRAEADMAVAAASILARDRFLTALAELKERFGIPIPKGASAQVQETARELVKQHGPAILLETVKCHFRTTDAVLAASGADRSALGPDGQAISKDRFTPHGERPHPDKPSP